MLTENSSALVSVETLSPEITQTEPSPIVSTIEGANEFGQHDPNSSETLSSITASTSVAGHQPSLDNRTGAQLDTPYMINGVILVNKKHHVSENYVPEVTDDSRPLDPTAQAALVEMLNDAEAEGYYFTKNSGYRSYQTQSDIFWSEANAIGEEEANKLTAYPGESEHQTGLAVDLTDDNNTWASFSDAFGELDSGKWLAANSYKYGFILRYPQGKEDITGYLYEPWHFRYVGKTIAADFGPNPTLTLEEYLGAS